MKKDMILRKNPDIVSREIEGETILLPIFANSEQANCIYSLNKPASFLWGQINGRRTVEQLKKILAEKFSSSDKELEKELAGLISDLKKIKAIK
jgi:hypothetical protein